MPRSFLLILPWQLCCAKDGTGSPFIRIALPCFSRGPKRRGEVPWGGFDVRSKGNYEYRERRKSPEPLQRWRQQVGGVARDTSGETSPSGRTAQLDPSFLSGRAGGLCHH